MLLSVLLSIGLLKTGQVCFISLNCVGLHSKYYHRARLPVGSLHGLSFCCVGFLCVQ